MFLYSSPSLRNQNYLALEVPEATGLVEFGDVARKSYYQWFRGSERRPLALPPIAILAVSTFVVAWKVTQLPKSQPLPGDV